MLINFGEYFPFCLEKTGDCNPCCEQRDRWCVRYVKRALVLVLGCKPSFNKEPLRDHVPPTTVAELQEKATLIYGARASVSL